MFMSAPMILLVLALSVAIGSTQDPHPNILRVMSYNTWYVFAKGQEQDAGCEFVLSQTPDVVALQELTNIQPEKLQQLASRWGHENSSLLKTSGFSVGLTSRWPIETIERRLAKMHHGYLHAKTNGVHYFVVHLSPFKWEVRKREAGILLTKIKPLIENKERVIVLGDFNAHAANDSTWLKGDEKLIRDLKKSDEQHEHVENLRDGRINYSVMELFLTSGLSDTTETHLPKTAAKRSTFTTGIWTDKETAPKTGQRIDFILASQAMQAQVQSSKIVRQGIVNKISDHYPVITDFKN